MTEMRCWAALRCIINRRSRGNCSREAWPHSVAMPVSLLSTCDDLFVFCAFHPTVLVLQSTMAVAVLAFIAAERRRVVFRCSLSMPVVLRLMSLAKERFYLQILLTTVFTVSTRLLRCHVVKYLKLILFLVHWCRNFCSLCRQLIRSHNRSTCI